MEEHMKPQISELEAQVIFKTFERKTKAEAILAEPLTPGPFLSVTVCVVCVVSSILVSYLMADYSIPTVSSLVGVLVSEFILVTFESRSLQRRLDAAVELLRLREIERT
jgi:hypothetical protein